MADTAKKLNPAPWHVETVLTDVLQLRLNEIYREYGRVDVSILPASNPFNCFVIWCEPGE